jgi:hypothetical protein
MNRSTTLLVIAVGLAAYGIYAASFVPAMSAGPASPVLLIGFLLQAVSGLAAAFGVWRRARWAAAAIIILGVCAGGTWLCEAFILGIVAWLNALIAAALSLLIALVIAVIIKRQA